MPYHTRWMPFFTVLPRRVRVIHDADALPIPAWDGGRCFVWMQWIETRRGADGRPEYAIRGRAETEDDWMARQW